MKLAVLITCFNRKNKTVACLEALFSNKLPSDFDLTVFLVDDGSTDGTSDVVHSLYPQVRIIPGTGKLYWGGGMRLAFSAAIKEQFDFYLWLNDDTVLYSDAVSRIMHVASQSEHVNLDRAIVVGSTRDAISDKPTYGGQRRSRPNRQLTFELVIPSDRPTPCDTINGNCVLISSAIATRLGNIDEAFIHSMGDIDYGLRAVRAGYELWVMPGFVGTCSWNASRGTYVDRDLPLRQRLNRLLEPKGLPIDAWKVLTKRHTGPLWFVYWLWPYTRVILESVLSRFSFSRLR